MSLPAHLALISTLTRMELNLDAALAGVSNLSNPTPDKETP
ncbi:hypothetical protein [Agromyces indicus]|uniref:Uncharacterized protein n=1 Tax=Agromyces indicus TaxID=758919 RepID=A0ABU1FKJ5_9MICO|nr:hypothetical protein [Agromyces indicus]MDR5691867.1 hypothetical protein [Agromyces indicus]